MLDRKGILSYLAVTFAITYAVEGALILAGWRVTALPPILGQYVIAAVMWVPALAAVLTIKLVTREGFGIANLRFGSWKPYVATALGVPLCFVVIYGLTWALGLARPDWQLKAFYALIASGGADMSKAPPPGLFLPGLFFASLIMAPFVNSLFGFGEELGWRGYLLPKLMPLGKARAYLLVGLIWGLWHAPIVLVGFVAPGYPLAGILLMIGLTTGLGLLLNELTLRYRSSILAGWIHGVYNSQAYGVWRVLFPQVHPLLGGMAGLVGLAVWFAVGLWVIRRGRAVVLAEASPAAQPGP